MQAFSTRVRRNAVPLKPVEVSDQYGFRSALYAVNALQKRVGESAYTEHEARVAVANLIRDSNVSKLSLLLRQWYSEKVDDTALERVVSELANRIVSNDEGRYGDSVVNNIEWSAMATSFRCCIAVKFVGGGGSGSGSGWKIAVPTPQIFGMADAYDVDEAQCVFVVCQKVRAVCKYVALIPSNQPIFKPGRALVRSKSEYEAEAAAAAAAAAAAGGAEGERAAKSAWRERDGDGRRPDEEALGSAEKAQRNDNDDAEPTSSAASSAASDDAPLLDDYGIIEESVLQHVNDFAVLGASLEPVQPKRGGGGGSSSSGSGNQPAAHSGVMYEMRLLFHKAFPDAPRRSANKVNFLH